MCYGRRSCVAGDVPCCGGCVELSLCSWPQSPWLAPPIQPMPWRILVVMKADIAVTDATVAGTAAGIGAMATTMAGAIAIVGVTAVDTTATVVGSMTAAAAETTSATVAIAAMATVTAPDTALITNPPADRVSRQRAVATWDANSGGCVGYGCYCYRG